MDRRQQYRVPADEESLEVFVSPPSGKPRVQAELLNLAVGGAMARVPPEDCLVVAVTEPLVLWLRDRNTSTEMGLEAKLVHRREEGRSRTLGLEFLDRRKAEALLTPSLARLFNRRGAFRVQPSPAEGRVEVTLQAPVACGLGLERAPLVDVSTGGIALDVSVAFEQGLAQHDAVECMFMLPGTKMPLAVPGRVRHRTLCNDGGVRYGVAFSGMTTPPLERTYDAILGYVLRRQRELGDELDAGRISAYDLLIMGGSRG